MASHQKFTVFYFKLVLFVEMISYFDIDHKLAILFISVRMPVLVTSLKLRFDFDFIIFLVMISCSGIAHSFIIILFLFKQNARLIAFLSLNHNDVVGLYISSILVRFFQLLLRDFGIFCD